MTDERYLLEALGRYVNEAIIQVCGGGIQDQIEKDQLRDLARTTISFPNQTKLPPGIGGKPHDIEVKTALSLFHRWKRANKDTKVEVISDLGIVREVPTPRILAELLVTEFLEAACRQDSVVHDLRVQPSGVICIITYARSELLRQAGRLPCPHCCQWCKGTKGLWWHQQQKHKIEYSEATTVASSSVNELAIVVYSPNTVLRSNNTSTTNGSTEPLPVHGRQQQRQHHMTTDDPIEFAKNGDLDGLKNAVMYKGYQPLNDWDRRGANPLHWAAGSGHLDIVKYLVEDCHIDPNQGQRGKRSFSGRTALHWAARNGHLETVEYLVGNTLHPVNLETATIDGTTAFCWAAWQGHLHVMDLLYSKGCNIHTTNSFGCNPVLWCAQGKGEESTILEWLAEKQSRMDVTNHNGHGVLHKAAQRGWKVGCHWFVNKILQGNNRTGSSMTANEIANALRLVGPDTEGYCPSDLAGMEGNEELAKFLVGVELDVIERVATSNTGPLSLPEWLGDSRGTQAYCANEQFVWEPQGGIRRMKGKLSTITIKSIEAIKE
ncbi:unnamed protein product [Cylindrotheca closterium]|uniref:Uncharacterized protein n=1 Tax=Cylindrotheca closterium TaxID=2856 RepID=A0AAD2G980_9STRA|nr:unnamed protein product [Cylindrotheca closterium]